MLSVLKKAIFKRRSFFSSDIRKGDFVVVLYLSESKKLSRIKGECVSVRSDKITLFNDSLNLLVSFQLNSKCVLAIMSEK